MSINMQQHTITTSTSLTDDIESTLPLNNNHGADDTRQRRAAPTDCELSLPRSPLAQGAAAKPQHDKVRLLHPYVYLYMYMYIGLNSEALRLKSC
jgi:hypothetical protein